MSGFDDWEDGSSDKLQGKPETSGQSSVWEQALGSDDKNADNILKKPLPSGPENIIKESYESSSVIDTKILDDLPLDVSILAGKTSVKVKNILKLSQGSIIELDQPADAPYCVTVQGRPFAKGDLVVINGKLGLKLTEIIEDSIRLDSNKTIL